MKLALDSHNAVMPTIDRVSDAPYRYRIGMAPLAKVANVEKFMPRDYITRDGFSITEKCKRYLRPLIRGEDHRPTRTGCRVRDAEEPELSGDGPPDVRTSPLRRPSPARGAPARLLEFRLPPV